MPEDGNLPAPLPPLAEELTNAVFAEIFPNGMPTKGRNKVPSASNPIVDVYTLDVEHLRALAAHMTSGASLGVASQPLKAVRHTHHKAAQLLALGMDEMQVALLCNLSISRISILKSDPLFQEVLNYYALQVQDAFVDTVDVMKRMTNDFLGELRDRLDDKPGEFTIPQLLETIKTLADRSGTGPTSNVNTKSTSVSLSGDDIRRIKGDAGDGAVTLTPVDGQARALPPEDRGALLRVAERASPYVAHDHGEEG